MYVPTLLSQYPDLDILSVIKHSISVSNSSTLLVI